MSKKRETFSIETLTGDLAERSRDLWLAGLGAIATVEEESTKFYDSLVERRKQLEEDGRRRLDELQKEATKIFDDLVKRGKKVETRGRKQLTARVDAVKDEVAGRQKDITGKVEQVTDKIEETVAGAVETVLERLEVPTHTEVKNLARKVDTLANKVNKLTALLEKKVEAPAGPSTVYHLVPRGAGWAVKQEGAEEPVFVTDTKAEALEQGRNLAKAHGPSRLVIHRQDGTIQERNVYGA